MKYFWFIFCGFNVLLFMLSVVLFAMLSRRQRNQPTEPLTPEEQLRRWEAKAPGWQIRCLKCGFTEPYGKYGIRMGAAGKKYNLGYCAQCRGFRFYVIERKKAR